MQRRVRLSRYQLTRTVERAAIAPVVPDALPEDNLLTNISLGEGLRVLIPEWDRVLPDDVLTVMWDDNDIHVHTVVDPSTQDWPYEFMISPEQLAGFGNGIHSLAYRVRADSGAATQSDTTSLKIDRTPPLQGNVPPTLEFPPEVVTGGLTSEYLAANNDEVIATIPYYNGMEPDQKVHPFWGNTSLGLLTITSENVGSQSVPIAISGNTVRSTGEGVKEAHYYLTSRAGFDGPSSDPSIVSVLLSPIPANLQAPVVPLAADGLIDLEDANAGVTIEIRQYDNALVGDILVAKWDTSTLSPEVVVPGAFPLEVLVPRQTLIAAGSGTRIVSYQIFRSGFSFDSPLTEVVVDITSVGPEDPDPSTPENEALEQPTVTGASGAVNDLGPDDLGANAQVTVPFYEGAALDQVITLYWGHAPNPVNVTSHTVDQNDLDEAAFPDLVVPAVIVDATPNDPALPVYYTLSRPLAEQPPANSVLSPAQYITVHTGAPGGPGGLDPAMFPDASANGWLLTEQVVNGVNVHVEVYENMEAGDVVTLRWQAFSATNAAPGTEIDGAFFVSAPRTVGAPELANGLSFVVPYETYVDAIAGAHPSAQGAGQVLYTVTQAGYDYTAAAAAVRIDLGAP
uniref:hypothetical protein n=1 Tax=Yersinia frederiksenii TaxID=29484 RepID=UPI001F4BD67C|nr:hypothetical protein [Yersinia frederiksenii]ULG19797.1 hypothetical protein 49p1_00079 [Yersinia frederiksenii]